MSDGREKDANMVGDGVDVAGGEELDAMEVNVTPFGRRAREMETPEKRRGSWTV